MHEGQSSRRALLETKVAELAKTKQEIQKAKESAMQSWLDSRPLLDELERQKSNLANAKNRSDTTVIRELESQLQTINKSIKSKREDQLKAETMTHEINHTLDQTRNEMERLKLDIQKKRQARAKLRQILQLRRQTLQTLQLTLQAVLLESDALQQSADETVHQINHSETNTAEVQLTHEGYYALTRGAEEKISQANRRVSVSMEKKLAAEDTRELALSRLKKFHSSRSWRVDRTNRTGQYTERDAEKQDSIETVANRTSASPKAHASLLAKSEGGNPHQSRRSRSNTQKMKEKPSILNQIKGCLGHKITKLWG